MKSYLQHLSLQQTINALKEIDFSTTAVVKKTTNTNKRLQKRIETIFPARGVLFVENRLKDLPANSLR